MNSIALSCRAGLRLHVSLFCASATRLLQHILSVLAWQQPCKPKLHSKHLIRSTMQTQLTMQTRLTTCSNTSDNANDEINGI
ncbi:hypothetical protein PF005_g7671 [Phytophthora fragariae]|uniref:Uncharacterized protein n=1 Tax=Phytophthora fragariae TaxID=53985 RepID=A0A6A4DV35_9STRA|nr:hypothetical protein PF003_g8126 [Phytophthora fragariae]KAE8941876.1 hypothetical protein PF009_g8347 [Phytophthora fragariae]KAE9123830.1 hypothetical protein PF007_g6921 [Phytophthora fragariae]KAE9148624.1 hypothetical protein PF006_g6806 [Phytophthora fragariae]KAE9219945.1 hypothetical protein PF005_g7671 [Phytophthora fragariae]